MELIMGKGMKNKGGGMKKDGSGSIWNVMEGGMAFGVADNRKAIRSDDEGIRGWLRGTGRWEGIQQMIGDGMESIHIRIVYGVESAVASPVALGLHAQPQGLTGLHVLESSPCEWSKQIREDLIDNSLRISPAVCSSKSTWT